VVSALLIRAGTLSIAPIIAILSVAAMIVEAVSAAYLGIGAALT
jgi:hypothetical protein